MEGNETENSFQCMTASFHLYENRMIQNNSNDSDRLKMLQDDSNQFKTILTDS